MRPDHGDDFVLHCERCVIEADDTLHAPREVNLVQHLVGVEPREDVARE
jgi:hypothetical protein